MKRESAKTLERPQLIVEAAIGVFLRYGYARTTMADIAKAAGLSRPNLYLSFPDKEEIFRAVMGTMVAEKIAAIREGLEAHTGLEAKLGFACESWGADGFDMVNENPDAKDMFDVAFEPVRDAYDVFEALIADLLSEPLAQVSCGVQAHDLARVITFGMKGFKDTAKDSADIRRMIATLVAIVSAALERANEDVHPPKATAPKKSKAKS